MYIQDFKASTRHPILIKHTKILETLNDERVMCVCYDDNENKFYIQEMCDDWYSHDLSKNDCLELAQLFSELADVME